MSGRARGSRPGVGLHEIDRLYVDGNNLLHRRSGTPTGAAPRLLLASMRAALPASLDVVLMLDGQPDPGAPHHEVLRRGLEVRFAGRIDADSVLVELVSARPFAERARTLVVT
ncbi:MAG: hypothetical protein H0W07_06730, partial [Chloroflexi bacterium]|nr:hypothetical protein [Chloroflexota bacterium]